MKVLFLVPKGYKSIGGMYLTIEHYKDYLDENGMKVEEVIEIPYHFNHSCFSIKAHFNELVSKNEYIVIGYTLNICYLMLKFFQIHKKKNCECISFLVDSMSLNMKSVSKSEAFGLRFAGHVARQIIYDLKERYCVRKCKKIVYVSKVDKDYVMRRFKKDIRGDIYAIPNGIDIKEYSEKFEENKNYFTIGTLTGFSPETLNNNLYPFLKGIFPVLVNEFPDIEFIIAGRGADKATINYLSEINNVDFIGEVENLDDFYSKVDAVITTVKKECGIITRILEAWSFKKINIGFSKNFAAFEYAEEGKDYLAADSPEDFVQAIAKILNNSKVKEEIEINGYNMVKNYYSWKTSGEALRKIVSNM